MNVSGDQVVGRALLVGCRGDDFSAVDFDMQAMAAMLERRGFEVNSLTGPRATRAEILAGYDDLIASVQPCEAAVFYYTGHGWYSVPDCESGASWQGICPTDVDASTTDDFRGITAWELSIKQAQLTARTKNVTVILDCCHAAQMSRDAAARAAVCRALPHPFRLGFATHFRALRAQYGPAFDAVGVTGNRDAVRLVACGQDESAFAYPVNGVYRGAFTEALLDVLDAVGDARVSWAALDGAIRERVRRNFLIQRPEIEGPTRRRPFSLDEVDAGDAVTITSRPDGFQLKAGRLMGITAGDVFGVMPPGALAYSAAAAVAEVLVTDTSATLATARLCRWSNGYTMLPEGAVAIPIEKQFVRRAVRIDVPAEARQVVTDEIAGTRTLRIAEPTDLGTLATLRLSDGALTIEDPLGPLFPARPFPDGLHDTVVNLADLGAAQALHELAGEHGVLASELDIEWGAVVRGEMRRMPESGGALALLDRIYVKVRSRAGRPLYVHVFNIEPQGKIRLLTGNAAPSGQLLTHEAPELVLGRKFDGTLPGLRLSWPKDLPRTLPRIDELAVIVTSVATSLRGLETRERCGAARGAGTPLQDLLAQLQDGEPRDLRGTEAIDGFYMKHFSYLLHPRDAMIADIPFEIDHSLRQASGRVGDAWIASSDDSVAGAPRHAEIAIEIADFVAANRLAARELRLDALICTRSTNPSGGYATWTQTYPAKNDAGRPTSGAGVVYRGPVHDFVEICLWVSPNVEGSSTLAELLAQRGDRMAIDDAARTLVVDSAGPAAPWIAATGATAALARTVHEVLSSETGQPLGLYRAAFLARDRFGIGDSSAERVQRTRDDSFAVRVVTIAQDGTRA